MQGTLTRLFRQRQRRGYFHGTAGRTWFSLVGKGRGVPLVVVHGGPAFPHDYLESLLPLAASRPLVFYDQIGCGKSDALPDTAQWTMGTLVRELDELISYLGFCQYAVLGHSSGAMVALDYALQKPIGLQGLVLASPIVSIAAWERDINSYRVDLPVEVRLAIEEAEKTGNFATPQFQAATNVFYARHVLRLQPWPEAYLRAAQGMNAVMYRTMWGPTEFICHGTLRSYNRTARLPEVHIPTLITCGRWEGADPSTMAEYAKKIPDCTVRVFEQSAHMPHLEQTEEYLRTVHDFLRRLDVQ